MSIITEPFGTTADGIAVERYLLTNRNGYRVGILTYGGIVQMLETADRHGKVADVVLGFDTLPPYLGEHPYFGAIIGRYANRIAQGIFTLDDEKYQLAFNNGPNHLHGGISGFDKRVWKADLDKTARDSSLVLSLISDDGDEGYPGTLSVKVRYNWNDSNALRIEYSATTDRSTILNLTNHSYFNLAGTHAKKPPNILQHSIQLNADRYLPVDTTLIPTGELANVTRTCMDFRKSTAIEKNLDPMHTQILYGNGGYDHAWILNASDGNLHLAAIVEEPVTGRRMQVFTTQPSIRFYTGNFLDGSLYGKNNTQYDKYAGFCLETQHYPDSPNHPEFPSTVLQPGVVFHQITIYQFDVSE